MNGAGRGISYFLGGEAFSDFELKNLLKQHRPSSVDEHVLTARVIFFVLSSEELSTEERKKLASLLSADCISLSLKPSQGVVLPRRGVISPWSSKVTDIVKRCGFDNINRIEHGVLWCFTNSYKKDNRIAILDKLYDPMLEAWIIDQTDLQHWFAPTVSNKEPAFALDRLGKIGLAKYTQDARLSLSDEELEYLYDFFTTQARNPTIAELFMFAQVNSEHCRHKIFRSLWNIDGTVQPESLLELIQLTKTEDAKHVVSAYTDNAAAITGYAKRFFCSMPDGHYRYSNRALCITAKVETHNHPTAIAPFPGAATGSGGEIRDELAIGIGGVCKAGLVGFSVSDLYLPNYPRPWELETEPVAQYASPLKIMLEAPIGAADFNNEFGRATLAGYFRSFAYSDNINGQMYGYYKPIMLAGGVGVTDSRHVAKKKLSAGDLLIVLGGASMRIGLGGGAASSQTANIEDSELDFASVQRHNPEMQRRAYEVIKHCISMGTQNPILSIHDVGAGGLSNALSEIVHADGLGAEIALANIPCAEEGMTPYEVWCNESQERFVLALHADNLDCFQQFCHRERAPFSVVGRVSDGGTMRVYDNALLLSNDYLIAGEPIEGSLVVDMPLAKVLDYKSHLLRNISSVETVLSKTSDIVLRDIDIEEALFRTLTLPGVANKNFLITIADRTVGGLTVRDQLVGPWQIAVSDCAITAASFGDIEGEAIAIGERAPLALINSAAAARMAVGEAITNITAARIATLEDVILSANWMAAAGIMEQDKGLYEAVKATSVFCRELDIVIPVGKDSLSMRTQVHYQDKLHEVISPVSLVISAFAPVLDIGQSLTPHIATDKNISFWLFDLGQGANRLGGSALLQVYGTVGHTSPDIEPQLLKDFFHVIQLLNESGVIRAYHDRSDGGLWVSLLEMAFASQCGLTILLRTHEYGEQLSELFNEELGAIIAVNDENTSLLFSTIERYPILKQHFHKVAVIREDNSIILDTQNKTLINHSLFDYLDVWNNSSHNLRLLRDNPASVNEERESLLSKSNTGLFAKPTFQPDIQVNIALQRPTVAILREQGTNGHVEMAAAFEYAGFDPIDCHMQDLLSNQRSFKDVQMLAVCGGFSYGDALGSGVGWGRSILYNPILRDVFMQFFADPNTLSLGVCNGCQMLSMLQDIIPGAVQWPKFQENVSGRFESRLVMVEVVANPSPLFADMEGSQLPIVISHGQGRAMDHNDKDGVKVTMRYIDNSGKITEHYPENPNGSSFGATGFTTLDGRHNIMMPHPERLFLTQQFSWIPPTWNYRSGPWLKLFQNSYRWLMRS